MCISPVVSLAVWICLAAFRSHAALGDVGVFYKKQCPQLDFAAGEINASLKSSGKTSAAVGELADLPNAKQQLCIAIAASPEESHQLSANLHCADLKPGVPPQSYALRQMTSANQTTCVVLAADSEGAMYGALDLAEAIRLDTLSTLRNSDHTPFISRRGIKFNIPLDARTPSYSDAGDSAQQNIPEMWSVDFWHEFLDEMARQRFNTLTLWNLHPFPSMVSVPEYPDIALVDVKRTTLPFDNTYALTGRDMVRPAQLAHLETIKQMTIDEKIKFWQEVMNYADDRGIAVYLFT